MNDSTNSMGSPTRSGGTSGNGHPPSALDSPARSMNANTNVRPQIRGMQQSISYQSDSPLRRAGLLHPKASNVNTVADDLIAPSSSSPLAGTPDSSSQPRKLFGRTSTTTTTTSSTLSSSSQSQPQPQENVAFAGSPPLAPRVFPHSQDSIRLSTMQLSEMILNPLSVDSRRRISASSASGSVFDSSASSGPKDRDAYPSSYLPGTTQFQVGGFDSSIAVEPRSSPMELGKVADSGHGSRNREEMMAENAATNGYEARDVEDINQRTMNVNDAHVVNLSEHPDANSRQYVGSKGDTVGGIDGDGNNGRDPGQFLAPFKSGLSLLLGRGTPTTDSPYSPSFSRPAPTLTRVDSASSDSTVIYSSATPSSTSQTESEILGAAEIVSGSPTPVPTRAHSPTFNKNMGQPTAAPSTQREPPPFRSKNSIKWDPKLDPQGVSHTPHHTSPPPPEIGSSLESASTTSSIYPSQSEVSPLLSSSMTRNAQGSSPASNYGSVSSPVPQPNTSPDDRPMGYIRERLHRLNIRSRLKQVDVKQCSKDLSKQSLRALPAVLLGSLLNILDGISYGMLIFPVSEPFTTLGPMGVSIFFVTAVVSQLVYTFGGSGFAGANGSMMIEVVPFFHILAQTIAAEIGEDKPSEVIATTLVAYAISSILTGLSFLLLGALKLGAIIGFFPRHILVGCIGGVGVFLLETGLTVSLRIPDDDFVYNLETLKMMFLETHNLALWTIPLALAVLLRFITSRWNHQLIFPVYFVIIPALFYIIVAAAQLDLNQLRHDGWLFDIVGAGNGGDNESWYHFYTYFHWDWIHLGPLWSTLPTQFALLFFNILHPPLNVPALSVSLNEDVDTNRELVGHGYSNLLAGFLGSVPNYLVYVNTLLFYRVGGDTRVSGFLLACATAFLLWIGTAPLAYIPVTVVAALIYVLGIDLVKEALWDTRHRVTRMEYITIASIMVAMTVWDFVIGVLFGIVVSCFFFVIQNSQRRSIRALHTGETAMSTVRRPSSQRAYIKEVSKQTTVVRLQGFLFFGTIAYVEETIRNVVEGALWQRNPVRFLVLDLSLVLGVDMSSAEAFVRILRLLQLKHITLVFCGFEADSPIGIALESVEVLSRPGVELFSTFNNAMEWTENCYLRAWFRSQKETTVPYPLPGRQDADIPAPLGFFGSPPGSPRRSHLHEAGFRTIANEIHALPPQSNVNSEPYNTLVRVFTSLGENIDYNQFESLIPYLQRISIPEGHVLWKQGDTSDGLYIIESGVLRASYEFSNHTQKIEESMVPGTLAGELSALSGLPRNATCISERSTVLWKLSIENLRKLEREEPEMARLFTGMVLKSAKIDYDILLSALASRQ